MNSVPKEIYQTATLVTLLTNAALEGAAAALNIAVAEKRITSSEAKRIMQQMLSKPSISHHGMIGGNVDLAQPTDLPIDPEIKKLANDLLSLGTSASKNASAIGHYVSKLGFGIASEILKEAIDTFVPKEILENDGTQLSPKVTQELNTISRNLKIMARDPQLQLAVKSLAEAAAEVTTETIDTIKPEINEVVNEVWRVAYKVGKKSVKTATTIAMALITTALAEVPVVGGIVIAGLEGGTIFNKLVDTGSRAAAGFATIADQVMTTQNTLLNKSIEAKSKLQAPIDRAEAAYENVQKKIDKANAIAKSNTLSLNSKPALVIANKVMNKKGGSTKKYRKHKSKSIELKIKKTLKQFGGKC